MFTNNDHKFVDKCSKTKKTIRKSNNVFGLTTDEKIIEPNEHLISFENCKKGYLVKSI